ncbi:MULTISPECIES: hypothetical protein [Acetobacter]|uniref:Uncharacterized protein n=1 Tax=Acetobacter pomorum DM001 TaxID=945681 RepID=F1YS90_9PROT|nr:MULTISPECIES: hypothetical protein [Acetobacter]ATI12608.1 hypothetical protein CPF11_09215 [Acetobacter pomorum]AXC27254.1 hypothetical protein DS739_11195 [Acetobacter sp. JWB]EGE48425.1 Hypothetical protein APO_0780 [Acetobacter pomorum DM001]KAA8421849.1 hypothetical protein FKW54_12410 [Acetobacter pomorum]KAA8435589.1 hypothetical protein FKW50_06500 [Acetobacter pomorum]
MAEHAYTMPGKRWAVLTLARLHGDTLAAIGAAGLSMLALAGFLHPEHLHSPSRVQAQHTQPQHTRIMPPQHRAGAVLALSSSRRARA